MEAPEIKLPTAYGPVALVCGILAGYFVGVGVGMYLTTRALRNRKPCEGCDDEALGLTLDDAPSANGEHPRAEHGRFLPKDPAEGPREHRIEE